MPASEDFELDPQTRERIRARAIERGAGMRRRTTVVRRSVTVVALLALAGGGVAIAETAHGVKAGGANVTGRTTSTAPYRTTTTPPPPGMSTTVPGGTSTTTSVPHGGTTSTTVPAGHSFSKKLSILTSPGTIVSSSWTVPSGQSVEISTIMLSKTSLQRLGQLRLQMIEPGAGPETLLAIDLGAVATRSFTFTLATPFDAPSGRMLSLSVTCNADQGACGAGATFVGEEVPASSAPSDDYSDALDAVAAPGTMARPFWTVPSGDRFSMTDLVLGSLGPINGTLEVLAGNRTVYEVSLRTLGTAPVHDEPQVPPVVTAGESVTVVVTCAKGQSACTAGLFFTGQLTSSGG
jgi:hypothetical protein